MKLAIILRGIPGSGKSVVARFLAWNYGAIIHSTDNYHIHNGVYTYDTERAAEYHGNNYTDFCDSCWERKPMVVVDNTNIWPQFYQPYTFAAQENGYKVLQIKLANATRVSTHNIPDEVLQRMKAAFKRYWKMRDPDYTLIIPADASIDKMKRLVTLKLVKILGEN